MAKETKNYEQRVLPVPAFLLAELKALAKGKAPDALLFSPDGEPLTRSAFSSVWRKAVTGAALDGQKLAITPKGLRDTAASLAVAPGANLKDVQRMLGHKSAALTLDVYAVLSPEGLHTVASKLDAARAVAA